jgi:hypothetical protein
VVRASDAAVAATGSNADRLAALFDVEKAVVFELLTKLGIVLTPAERTAISERPTRDIQAFLLYSRGLESADRGDYGAAAAAFGAAARLDPGFHAAADQAAASDAAQAANATSPTDLASGASASSGAAGTPTPGALTTAINNAVPSGAGLLDAIGVSTAAPLPPTDPNRLCEGATCDGPARAVLVGTLIIILKRP